MEPDEHSSPAVVGHCFESWHRAARSAVEASGAFFACIVQPGSGNSVRLLLSYSRHPCPSPDLGRVEEVASAALASQRRAEQSTMTFAGERSILVAIPVGRRAALVLGGREGRLRAEDAVLAAALQHIAPSRRAAVEAPPPALSAPEGSGAAVAGMATIFAASRDGFAQLDADECIVWANAAFAAPYGAAAERLTGRNWRDLLRGATARADGERPALLAHDLAAPDTEMPEMLVTSRGRWFELRRSPAPDGGVLLQQIDCTARRNPGTMGGVALADLPLPALRLDGQGRIADANGAAARLCGVPISTMTRLFLDDVFGPVDGDAGARLPVTEEGWRPVSVRIQGGTGGRTLLIARGSEVRPGGRGGEEGEVVLLRPADALLELAARAESAETRASESRGIASRFLATVGHELRTPLNAIIGFSEVLASRSFGDLEPRQHEYITDIHGAGLHLLEVIDQVLDFARIEAGRMPLDETEIDLVELVDDCLRIMRPLAERAGVELRRAAMHGLPTIRGDRRALRQVVINLVSNAVKFTGRGGSVSVRHGWLDGRLVLSVEDTGRGMARCDIPAALEPYRRLDSSAGGTEGSGLGLSIVKSLVDLHEGEIRIDSSPDEGTTVDVVLPPQRLAGRPPAVAALA